MFGRRTKAALAALDPDHRGLIEQRTLSASHHPEAWRTLADSLVRSSELLPKPRHALPPRTLDLLVPLIRVTALDVPDDGYLGVTADLRGPDVPDKQGPRRELPATPPVRSVVEQVSTDPWLAMQATLRNDARLRLSVTDVVRMRTITKRSQSGKLKTKRRPKVTQRVRVRLDLPKGVTPVEAATAPAWLQRSVTVGTKRATVDVKASYPIGHMQPAHQLQSILLALGEAHRCTPTLTEEAS